jgi:hypothetical protein
LICPWFSLSESVLEKQNERRNRKTALSTYLTTTL